MAMLDLNHIVIKALDIAKMGDDSQVVQQGKSWQLFVRSRLNYFVFIFSCKGM